MTVRTDLHQFLTVPNTFSSEYPEELHALGEVALDEFARPRLEKLGRPLRPAQERAWRGLAPLRAGLVLGPPGTGKTFLLAWLASGHLWAARQAQRPCRIFVCGFTREAIGNLMEDVARVCRQHLPDVPLGFFGNEPDQGLPDGVEPLPLRPKLLKAARDWLEQTYHVAGGTVWSLSKLFADGAGPDGVGPSARAFDLVLVDEASQMVLSYGLLALSGLAEHGKVIAAGDDRQLLPIRATCELTRSGGREFGGSLYTFLVSADVPEFRLDETYRLNAPLAEPVSELFYDGEYHSAVPERRLNLRPGWEKGLEEWQRLALDPEVPLVVLLHDGPTASTENAFERGVLHQLMGLFAERLLPADGQDTLDASTLWKERLAVVTPHRAQNAALREQVGDETWGANPVVETVDRIQGRERDVLLAGYAVSDPEFIQIESGFLFSAERLNVTVTRARSKLVLLVSRQLLEALPGDEEVFDAACQLREYICGGERVGRTVLAGDGRGVPVEFWVRRFADSLVPTLTEASDPTPAEAMRPIRRLTYDSDVPTNEQLREILPAGDDGYLYITATMDLARRRKDLASSLQRIEEEEVLRFDQVIRHLLRDERLASPYEERICLQRGIGDAIADAADAERIRHDLPHWLEALQNLEQRGIDLSNGFGPEERSRLVVPSLAPVLQTLQHAHRQAKQDTDRRSFDEAAREFFRDRFETPELVVLEGFTYLLPLQQFFVERCVESGAKVLFVHPHRAEQARGFAIMDRTYTPYRGQERVTPLTTQSTTTGTNLRRLQECLFADAQPQPATDDDSVSLRCYRHRHREVANCLLAVRQYLEDGTYGPDDIAIVTRNPAEMQTIFQEEARRLGMQEMLRIAPRTLLLTPLGRFALTLYDIYPDRALRMTPDQFETLLVSGWLGPEVQRSSDAFGTVRSQFFEGCETAQEWRDRLAVLAQECNRTEPMLDRLASGRVKATDVALWSASLDKIERLCGRLMDGRTKNLATHIRRLRDELEGLNPYDLRKDEKALVERICTALGEVVGTGTMRVSGEEFGQVLTGLAREYDRPDPDPEETEPGTIPLMTPEAIDSDSKKVVFYLGVDAQRVPRAKETPWPFFELDRDENIDRERYFFLAVVRAAKERLHLSYALQGEDQAYDPSLYIEEAEHLLGSPIEPGEPDEAVSANPDRIPLPLFPGSNDEYDLSELAIFGLCPHRYRLERTHPDSRRFSDAFQQQFLAQGVWLEMVFEGMVGRGPFRAPEPLREALYSVAAEVRDDVRTLFAGLGRMAWDGLRRALKFSLDYHVDGWLGKPGEKGKCKLDYGVTFEHAPQDKTFVLTELDGVVRYGLRHVVRAGSILYPLYGAQTYQHWLLPKLESEESRQRTNEDEDENIFPLLEDAVRWWSDGVWAALVKEVPRFVDKYVAFRADVEQRVRQMHEGKFPKRVGAHCSLCPVKGMCLGIEEEWESDE